MVGLDILFRAGPAHVFVHCVRDGHEYGKEEEGDYLSHTSWVSPGGRCRPQFFQIFSVPLYELILLSLLNLLSSVSFCYTTRAEIT